MSDLPVGTKVDMLAGNDIDWIKSFGYVTRVSGEFRYLKCQSAKGATFNSAVHVRFLREHQPEPR